MGALSILFCHGTVMEFHVFMMISLHPNTWRSSQATSFKLRIILWWTRNIFQLLPWIFNVIKVWSFKCISIYLLLFFLFNSFFVESWYPKKYKKPICLHKGHNALPDFSGCSYTGPFTRYPRLICAHTKQPSGLHHICFRLDWVHGSHNLRDWAGTSRRRAPVDMALDSVVTHDP